MLMTGDEAAFLERDACEHGLIARDELTGEEGVELLGGDVGPAGVEGFSGHLERVHPARSPTRTADVEVVAVSAPGIPLMSHEAAP